MHLVKHLRTGRVQDAEDGELLALSYGNGKIVYCVVAKQVAPDNVLLVTFNDDAGSGPKFQQYHRGNECVLLGKDWAFEIVAPTDAFADSEKANDIGSVCLEGDRATMRVGASPSSFMINAGYVDVSNFSVCEPVRSWIVIRRWRVWRNVEDINDPHKRPLVDYAG